MTTPRIDPERLIDFGTAVYTSVGMPEADARLVADTLVQADLWGHQSHGVLRLGWYLDRVRNGVMKPVTKPEFVVDAGSITRAADLLHIAQPALSQQMTALESLFGQQLLSRSKQGVEPTEAGRVLYRHARVILRQLEQAHAEVEVVGRELAGGVSVGLAPYSTVNALGAP